jgi:hypothetical protein
MFGNTPQRYAVRVQMPLLGDRWRYAVEMNNHHVIEWHDTERAARMACAALSYRKEAYPAIYSIGLDGVP